MKLTKAIIGLAALALTACDFTDLTPTDKVGDSQISTSVSTLKQSLNGVFSKASWKTTIGATATLSDDVIKGGQNGGAHDDNYKWTYSASTGDHSDLWSSFYGVIAEANTLIDNSTKVKAETDADKKELDDIVGNAIFLRSYFYFDLVRFFSDFNDKASYGVPYTDKPVLLETLGRNSVEECYTFLLRDLNEAVSKLSADHPANNGYASKDAARALMARIYLYAKDYDNAYKTAKQVLDANPIASISEYPNIWIDRSTKEVLFSINCTANDEKLGNVFFWDDKSSLFEASQEIIDSFDPADTRLALFIDDGLDRDNVPVKRIIKHKGATAKVGLVNEKMLRSSEMLLIMAEAKANQAGGMGEANSLLNQLRKNRINGWTDKTYSTKEEFMAQINLERRHELCYEGHRWFDLRRWNLPITKGLISKTLEVNDYHRIYPIPLSELESNPTIAKQQNKGYQ